MRDGVDAAAGVDGAAGLDQDVVESSRGERLVERALPIFHGVEN